MTNPNPHTALFRVAILPDTDSDKANLNQKVWGILQYAYKYRRITLKNLQI